MIKCVKCEFELETEKLYQKHLDDEHELWRVTQPLCDYICNGGHGMHICWDTEVFDEWKGFEMHNIKQNRRSGEPIFKCVLCDFTDEDRDVMKRHIKDKHVNFYTKCGLCSHKFHTWKGMIDHYEFNHMKPEDFE